MREPVALSPEARALSLQAEASALNVEVPIGTASLSLSRSLPIKEVIDLAFHRDNVEPLAACIESGSASERKSLADWFRKYFLSNTEAVREVRNRQIVNLSNEGWNLKQLAEKFGLTTRQIRNVLEECNDGTVKITPPTA
jgi:hypothetical protein